MILDELYVERNIIPEFHGSNMILKDVTLAKDIGPLKQGTFVAFLCVALAREQVMFFDSEDDCMFECKFKAALVDNK